MSTCTNCGDDHDFTAPNGVYAGLCYTCALGAACTDAARAVLDDRFVQPAACRCADAVTNLIEAWRTAGVEISDDREEMERDDAQVMQDRDGVTHVVCRDAGTIWVEEYEGNGTDSATSNIVSKHRSEDEALGAARMLDGNCLEKCSDCGVLLRDCGPRCAVCDDTSTDDSE